MNILDVQWHDKDELIYRLRTVQLKGKHPVPDNSDLEQTIYPYLDANIQLVKIRTEFLSLPQTYILQENIQRIRELKYLLGKMGYNIHELNGYIVFTVEDKTQPDGVKAYTLMPTVVELSIEADSSPHFLINDGMHRITDAHISHTIPQMILISGVKYPYYAYPIRGGFNDVQLREDIPEGFIKKWHRYYPKEEYTKLYRRFESAFENVGDQRGHFIKPNK